MNVAEYGRCKSNGTSVLITETSWTKFDHWRAASPGQSRSSELTRIVSQIFPSRVF